jgi:translation initiation factor 4G
MRARRRSLGNIRFIGELYKLKMLTARIMHECLKQLLRSPADEEALECLCRLLATVGKDLEAETDAKIRADKEEAKKQVIFLGFCDSTQFDEAS